MGWLSEGFRGSGVVELDSRGLGRMLGLLTVFFPEHLYHRLCCQRPGSRTIMDIASKGAKSQALAKPDVISRYSLITPRTVQQVCPQVSQASQEGSLGSVNMANATTHDCVR